VSVVTSWISNISFPLALSLSLREGGIGMPRWEKPSSLDFSECSGQRSLPTNLVQPRITRMARIKPFPIREIREIRG